MSPLLPLACLTALLVELRGNASCQFFSLKSSGEVDDFDNEVHVAALEGALSSLLAHNTTLTTLKVHTGDYPMECDLQDRILNSLLVGLGANGSVQDFDVPFDVCVSRDVARRVIQMLESCENPMGLGSTLKRIRFRFVVT